MVPLDVKMPVAEDPGGVTKYPRPLLDYVLDALKWQSSKVYEQLIKIKKNLVPNASFYCKTNQI